MRIKYLLVVLILAGLGGLARPAQGQEARAESFRGDVLCMTGLQTRPPAGECLEAGPAAYIKRMKQMGFSFPLRTFSYARLDTGYTLVDYRYAWVRDDVKKRIPLFASLEDARSGKPVAQFLENNFSYITYQEIVDSKYVLADSGFWMLRGDVTPVAVPGSQGIVLRSTPPNDFGWTFDFLRPRRTPGYASQDVLEKEYPPNKVVPVYSSQMVDGAEWYLIGVDEWVEGRLVNRVDVNTSPPQGVDNGRWIEINLDEQTLAVYDQRRLVFATLVATGLEPLWTRPGLFPIRQKLDTTPMSGSFTADRSDYYYLENVPWTMYFDEARALHGAYWRTKLGHPQSHGCVNLTIGDARWVFDWAQEGDWVYVWDPSGRTPTDPGRYGQGGA
jgi:hypothetical protein